MKKLLVVGGDRRMVHLAKLLEEDGFSIQTLGLEREEEVHIEQADAVLFPYPFSVQNGRIPVLMGQGIPVEEVLDKVRRDTVLVCGRGMEGILAQESPNLKRYTDASNLEQRNAELSAEAAVCEAMLHSGTALMDANVLITGYGRFGRALALRLKALGTSVWIAARREAQRVQAALDGMQAVSLLEMDEVLPRMNLVMNTIPARIFSEYHLKRIPHDCWLLEMASAPYGADPDTARTMGVNCAALPGLPGKYSPLSAAMALQEAVYELLKGGRA